MQIFRHHILYIDPLLHDTKLSPNSSHSFNSKSFATIQPRRNSRCLERSTTSMSLLPSLLSVSLSISLILTNDLIITLAFRWRSLWFRYLLHEWCIGNTGLSSLLQLSNQLSTRWYHVCNAGSEFVMFISHLVLRKYPLT